MRGRGFACQQAGAGQHKCASAYRDIVTSVALVDLRIHSSIRSLCPSLSAGDGADHLGRGSCFKGVIRNNFHPTTSSNRFGCLSHRIETGGIVLAAGDCYIFEYFPGSAEVDDHGSLEMTKAIGMGPWVGTTSGLGVATCLVLTVPRLAWTESVPANSLPAAKDGIPAAKPSATDLLSNSLRFIMAFTASLMTFSISDAATILFFRSPRNGSADSARTECVVGEFPSATFSYDVIQI